MKKYIPLSVKKILWWLLKSPQRNIGFWYSLRTEFLGYIAWLGKGFTSAQKMQPVSICTGIKNRTANYLNYLLTSVEKMKHPELIELCLYDCGSDDASFLEAEIKKRWRGKLVFVNGESMNFERSFTFNKAIRQSTSPIIFAADADMSLPEDLVEKCNRNISKKNVWFPICFTLFKDKEAIIHHGNGKWYPDGMGMFAAYRNTFEKTGGLDESYKTWGGEDWELWKAFYRIGIFPMRTKCKGLFHHYHPSLKPDVWVKNMPNISPREK